jgi:GTP-binding protein
VVVADMPGTTRDSVRIPLERDGRQYLLIDTAGMRRRARVSDRLESYSVIKALRAIQEANVAILVLDARREISGQDANLVGYILEAGKGLVLAVNKWDGLPGERRREIRDELDRKLNFISFAPPVFISARHGSGLGELLQHVNRAWSSSMASFGTSYLNRILEKAITANPPPRSRGRRIRLKFAHQCGHNPPRIRIHGTQAEAVPQAYRRFLENTFRRALELEGTPLGVEFSSAANPYAR